MVFVHSHFRPLVISKNVVCIHKAGRSCKVREEFSGNSGLSGFIQWRPDAMHLASMANKGRPRTTLPFKLNFIQIPLHTHSAPAEASRSQVNHPVEARKLDGTEEEHGTNSPHLTKYFNCLKYGQQDTVHPTGRAPRLSLTLSFPETYRDIQQTFNSEDSSSEKLIIKTHLTISLSTF